MKQTFTIILFCIPLFLFGQDGMIGTGFANGWNNPGDIVDLSNSAGNSNILTTNPNGMGNQYFRFVSPDNTAEYGPFGCSDTDWTSGVNTTYNNMSNCISGGAFYINCPNMTDNYVFKTKGDWDNDFIYFRVQGDIRTITSVSSPASGMVNENVAYEVRATLNDPLNTGQKVYLRYSTDNWSSSSIMEMMEDVGVAVPTDYLATIPGQSSGTTVKYYVLTSGEVSGILNHGNADWFTINLNNNGGPNYEYDVTGPLAVTYLNFEAKKEGDNSLINWITVSESNNSHFEVERSQDSRNWEMIGSVGGQGNSLVQNEYTFVDKYPELGENYYRLKQVDFDGTLEYSDIAFVDFRKESTISVFPNPVKESLTIQSTTGNSVQFYDLNGQLLNSKILQEETTQFEFNAISQGVYLLRITDQSGELIESLRIVKL